MPEESNPLDTEPDEEVSVTVTPPLAISGEEAAELCPTPETISAATGLSITDTEAMGLESDYIGSDPASGGVVCGYEAEDSSFLTLTLHGSPINRQLFLDLPPEGVQVDELPSGAVQIAFEGQPGCEVYDGQVSVVLSPEFDSADYCELVAAVAEAAK